MPTSSGGAAASGGVTKLFDSTLGADAATIDSGAASIVGTYTALDVLLYSRTTKAATAFDELYLRVNADAGANYDWVRAGGVGTTATNSGAVADNGWDVLTTCAGNTSSVFGLTRLTIHNYAGTTGQKSALAIDVLPETTVANERAFTRACNWRSTAAITRLSVVVAFSGANLLAGSRMTIWGL